MQEEQRKDNEKKALLQELKGKEDVTLDGKKIKLYSNIGNIKDLANVIANDAAGIGLFRVNSYILNLIHFQQKKNSSTYIVL